MRVFRYTAMDGSGNEAFLVLPDEYSEPYLLSATSRGNGPFAEEAEFEADQTGRMSDEDVLDMIQDIQQDLANRNLYPRDSREVG